MRYLKVFEDFEDFANGDKEKNDWWQQNYEKLIQYATNLQYDDWMAIFENDEEGVDATMDQTGKHKALTLLTMFSVEELDEMLEEDGEFDDFDEDLD